jgi:hypothetical protein
VSAGRRFALVTHGLPHPTAHGGAMTCWALQHELLDRGHEVAVVTLAYPGDELTHSAEAQALLRDTGATLDVEELDPGDLATGRGSELDVAFPTLRVAPRVARVLEQRRPDAVFVYHWDSLAATHGLRLAPRLAGVDDPWHLPNRRRWAQARPRPTLAYLRWTVRTLRAPGPVTRAMVALLNDCEGAGAFQSATAASLRRAGARRCDYLRAPLLDPSPGGLERPEHDGPVRVLLGPSQLGATTTAAGLRFFARDVLPELERLTRPGELEVHVVGRGAAPPELERLLSHPLVVMRGFVDSLERVFTDADVQLAPTPFVLGKRMRIVVGFAYSTCVVAHAAEAANLPELVDGENVLLGPTGREIAQQLVRVARDGDLRRSIGRNGRRTYESNFHPSVAARELAERLERLGDRRLG